MHRTAQYICIIVLSIANIAWGWTQNRVFSLNYTVESGLAQNSVSDVCRDSSGFVWLTTRDGLSRFDGKEFKNFKADSKSLNRSVSNQFRSIQRDAFNCFWITNDIGQVLRFSPTEENFTLYPSVSENRGDNYFSARSLVKMSDHEFWLLGHSNGCIRIQIDSTDGDISLSSFYREKENRAYINKIYRDTYNRTWILTHHGIALLAEVDTLPSSCVLDENGTNPSIADAIEVGSEILFAADNGVLYRYDLSLKRFSSLQAPWEGSSVRFATFKENELEIKQKDGTLWLFNPTTSSFRRGTNNPSLGESEILTSHDEKRWIAAHIDEMNVMWRLSEATDTERDMPMEALYSDTMGVFWSPTESEGVRMSVETNNSFVFAQCVQASSYAQTNDVLTLSEDSQRRLWIATKDGCVRLYSEVGYYLGCLSANGSLSKDDRPFGITLSIHQDRKGNTWLGMENGVVRLTPLSDTRFEITRFESNEKDFEPLSNVIRDILEDSKGHIWLATDGGITLLDLSTGAPRFIHKGNLFKDNYPPSVEQTKCLLEDRSGNVWMGASEGITVFSSDFSSPDEIRFFFYNTENTNLSCSSIYDIMQDRNGRMWFASFGGGLFHIEKEFFLFETPEFVLFNQQNRKFPSDLVLGIEEDEKGLLWVVTEDAIVKFDPSTSSSEPYGRLRGLSYTSFSEKSIVRLHSGGMVVGANAGFYRFTPSQIVHSDYCPPIVWTRLLLFNREVGLNDENTPLSKAINYMEEITLQPDQSVFSIGYAALDFRGAENIQYAYKLDNFESEWNHVGTQNIATYKNLPKGTYYFRVRSTNSEGVWYENDRVLKIVVLPTFWNSSIAYLLYLLFGIAVVYGIVVLYRMRTRISIEREMASSKLQFFTDVSHELRTPLTLINAPLENVLQNGQLTPSDREQLEVVHTNADRMLRMMNQILDFRKIQSNKMRLRVERTNLGEFVSSCSSNFLRLAENRDVKFSITDNSDGASFWVDKDKIDTVMFNLLSNAFKFTPSGKSVKVSVSVENGEGVIRVEDEGCGMPSDKLSTIFERYVTLQNYSLTRQSGTGIGLSLVKEIVEMHKATVTAESEENVGTTFTVRLLPGIDHFDETADIVVSEQELTNTSETGKSLASTDNAETTLLVVEDNAQLRSFLVSVLTKRYRVMEAANGRIGYETALRETPDFIITDIMMPEMDGIELTRKIRETESISHIPIVLLTAKTDMESRIDCLKLGANDYITKPFNMNYLETRIENIIAERKKWQTKYRQDLLKENTLNTSTTNATDTPLPTTTSEQEEAQELEKEVALNEADKLFMQRLMEFIEANIENAEFSVEEIQDHLKISRWHLLTKVKGIVGLTPVELIRETRLLRAAKLIEEGEHSMTQITYMIGMTDSRYFSRCFKQKFKVTPTEYKEGKRMGV